MRLGILTSHPIQYYSPWFRALAREVELEVFFSHRQSAAEQGKAGFGVAFEWDVDLLAGYTYRFLNNKSKRPDVNHFTGCNTPEIREIIRAGNFDAFIVLGWYLKSFWQAIRACRRAGVPVFVRGDSQLHTPRSWLKRWIKKLLYHPLLRQFNGFLVVGQRNREYLAHYGVPAEKMFFAPHFVDNEWFEGKAEIARKQKAESRKKWGADINTLIALFVGKFQAIKRPQDILHALATLNHQQPTINSLAVFVGSGELENELRALAAALKVAARFEGFRNQSELPRYYAAADVLVLPSESESWGLVVNEAMACGLPAIVSNNVGCAPDLIEEGRTGFTFPLGDVGALSDRLAALATLKQSGHVFAQALEVKMSAFSLPTAVEGTLTAINTLTRHHD